MDWLAIISAHVLWKKRLLAMLDGSSDEKLVPEAIGMDDKCALGKWIYSDGQTFSSTASYETVRAMHAEFHRLAAEVVTLYQAGKIAEAEQLLQREYSRHSERLKHRILALSHEVGASDATPPF
ncbi:MAG TPA: CZB domain-containing protein [Thiobacillaceae bacterium]|nr:CZB domain-containing protein [Thiobacillaceae bacterium]